jgi:hypothetical protein
MKISTDLSIQESWKEGYLIMDYKVRQLFPKKGEMDQDYASNFYCSDGSGDLAPGMLFKIIDTDCSFSGLLSIYEKYKDEIDQLGGYDENNPRPDMDNPTAYCMLNLASDINSYCGLD